MRLNVNGNIVRLWDSIEEMPITRYQDFNKYLMIDSGIGSDTEDVIKHTVTLERFITEKKQPQALKELANMRQNMMFILAGINPKHDAFAQLVREINGKAYNTVLTRDDIEEIKEELDKTGMSFKKMAATLDEVKKKLDVEFEVYFPETVNNVTLIDYFTRLKRFAILIAQKVQGVKDIDGDIDKIEKSIIDSYEPKIYSGDSGLEVTHTTNFNETSLALSQRFNKDPDKLTVLKFYQLVELVKQQNKKNGN